ncbi:Hypothetical protein A7982_00632 [Minicystis rosea]|nr:Hypothetical protein A7982_00632 [Minicystis rosea]
MPSPPRAHPNRRTVVLGALAVLLASGCGLFPKTRTPALAARAPAPSFDLAAHTGKRVTLAELTARGPAMLVFYRGYW